MMLASLQPPSMNAGFVLKFVPSTRTRDRRNRATCSAKVVNHRWNCSLDIDAVLSNQRSSITSLDGRSMISPQSSSYTDFESAIAFPPCSRFLGCRLGSGRNAQKRSFALPGQVEGCDADAQPQVERTRELEVMIGGPLGNRGQDRAPMAPSLHEEPSKARRKRQPRRLRTKHRMTPPGPRVLGESVEDRGRRPFDDDVEGNIDGRPRRFHARPATLDAVSEAEDSGNPARRQGIEPAAVDLPQRDRVQVVTSLATPLPAGDQASLRKYREVPHHGDSRDAEVCCDLASYSRPFQQ